MATRPNRFTDHHFPPTAAQANGQAWITDGGSNRSEDAIHAIREECRGAGANPGGPDDARCRWLGISASGAGTTHVISGTFAQTAAGVLALRVASNGNDMLQVTGAARLAGTEVSLFQPGSLSSFVTAALGYTPADVTLNLTSGIAQVTGLSPNQTAIGGALDRAFNFNGS